MSITQLDTENADRNLTTSVAVLTNTPSTTDNMQCQGVVYLGDGTKNLDGTGGDFELVVTVGGQTIQPSPQIITFGTEVRSCVFTTVFPVPANNEVILKVMSPNAGDTDVDVTAYLYNVHTENVVALGGDATAGTNLKNFYLNVITTGTVSDAGATSTDFDTDLTEASDDHYNGLVMVFITSTKLKGQARSITDYNGTTKNVDFTGNLWTEAPDNGDAFMILGRIE